jgi:trimethylamine--corrinoid protein Co-methyltransferase
MHCGGDGVNKLLASVQVLSQNEIEQINEGAFRVLINTGVKVPNVQLLEICKKGGAIVDKEAQTVYFPKEILENLIDLARKNRSKCKMLKPVKKVVANISTQTFFLDIRNHVRRYGLMDDIMKGICLIDQLDYYEKNNPIVVPSDVPYNESDVRSIHKILTYSRKEGSTYILSATSAKYIFQMLKSLGREFGYYLNTISPLQYAPDSLEMAVLTAKEGGKISLGSMVMSGITGPITIAGTLVLSCAEILASLFIIFQLTGKFAEFGNICHSVDPSSMMCSFGAPNQGLFAIATAQLAEFYGLESRSNTGLTDAINPDFQAGFEKTSTALFSVLAGCGGVGAMGIAGADQGISLEQIVLDHEWISAVNFMLGGITVNEKTLAVQEIIDAGHEGDYINRDHTVEFLRESIHISPIIKRLPYESWISNERRELLDRVDDFIRCKTENYMNMEPAIDEHQREQLDLILNEAVQELSMMRKRGN